MIVIGMIGFLIIASEMLQMNDKDFTKLMSRLLIFAMVIAIVGLIIAMLAVSPLLIFVFIVMFIYTYYWRKKVIKRCKQFEVDNEN